LPAFAKPTRVKFSIDGAAPALAPMTSLSEQNCSPCALSPDAAIGVTQKVIDLPSKEGAR